jgi:hypothetical protein
LGTRRKNHFVNIQNLLSLTAVDLEVGEPVIVEYRRVIIRKLEIENNYVAKA